MNKELEFLKNEVSYTETEDLEFLKSEVFKIHPYTKSIDKIEKNSSENSIRSTIEYNQYGQEIYSKLTSNNIELEEAKKLMHKKFIQLRNKNRVPLKRKRKKKLKFEDDVETLVIHKKYKIDLNLYDMEETQTFTHKDISIIIPTRKSILKHIHVDRKYNYYCFVTLTLTGPTIFGGVTSKVPILNIQGIPNNDYDERMTKALNNIIERIPDYEEKESNIVCTRILITITQASWKSIDNWYPKITRKYKKFKDFTLFLASDRKENCLKQCVEKLGGKWNHNKKLEDMLPQKKIITYIPALMDIQYVNSMDDLITDYNEEIYSLECKNIARLLKWNGHIGVITKIEPTRKMGKIQKQKRLGVEDTNTEEIFFDIESFTNEKNFQIPYLICWSKTNGSIHKRIGKNCINDFVEHIINLKKNVILYAWFGSGYDYQHVLPYFKKKCIKDKYIIKNNMITYSELYFKHSKIILKDPFLFILTSLDKAAKAFNVINKGSFPHSLIKDWPDLQKIYPHWIKTQRKIIEFKHDNKLNIKINTTLEEDNITNNSTIIEKAIEYCSIDVIAMKQVWEKFKKLVKENLQISISEKTFTLSQLSMKIMEASLDKKIELYVPTSEEYQFIRNSIYGGRVAAKNGTYNEEIVYADVVSLYPSAMKLLKHSYGKPSKVFSIDFNKHGIYDVTLIHKSNSKPKEYLEFVPRRIDKKLIWSWFKEHRGTYHTYDLLIAIQEGFEIICHSGIEYPNKDYIFNNFIDKLYTLKDIHTNCKCKEQPCPIRMVAKIALNGGGYGKFVQKPIDKEVYIVKRDVVAGECENLSQNENGEICIGKRIVKKPKFFNLDGEDYDKMIIEREDDPIYSTQCGVSILSASRYRLYNLCKKFKGLEIIYSDTDSIFVRKSTIDWELFKNTCGKNLGELDSTIDKTKNAIIHYMLIGGPKMYAFQYKNNENKIITKLHCKGVPTFMLSIDQFEYLLQKKDRKLAYHFEIIRRKLVTVTTDKIIKDIKQT